MVMSVSLKTGKNSYLTVEEIGAKATQNNPPTKNTTQKDASTSHLSL